MGQVTDLRLRSSSFPPSGGRQRRGPGPSLARALGTHARDRAAVLSRQAVSEQDFANRVARDRPQRKLLAELRFRVRHLRHLAQLWRAFADGAI